MKLSLYSRYVEYLLITVTIDGRDCLVYLNRSSHPYFVDFQIWHGKILKSPFVVMNMDKLKKAFESELEVYYNEVSIDNFMTVVEADESSLDSIELDIKHYAKWMKMDRVWADMYRCSFEATQWEVDTIPLVDASGKRIAQANDNTRLKNLILRISKAKRKMYIQREDVDYDDSISEVTTLSTEANITITMVDRYLWLRHEILAKFLMQYMNVSLNKTDMSFKKYPAFKDLDFGEFNQNLTPDLITEVFQAYHVIEFTATDGDPLTAMRHKQEKYASICSFLSSMLEKPVEFSVCVMDSNKDVYIFGAASQEYMLPRRIPSDIATAMMTIEQRPSYKMAKKRYDLLGPDTYVEDTQEAMTTSNEIIEEVMGKDLKVLSHSFETSMDKDQVNNVYKVLNSELVDASQEKISKYTWKSGPFDEREFVDETFQRQASNKFTKEIQEISKTTEEDTVKFIKEKLDEMIHSDLVDCPKVFKLPYIGVFSKPGPLPHECEVYQTLDDGTKLVNSRFRGFKESKHTDVINIPVSMISDMECYMMDMSKIMVNGCKDMVSMVESTEFFHCLMMFEKIANELMRLTDRRLISKKKKHGAFREYDDFSLLIANGPMLKDQNQVVFKVMIEKPKKLINNLMFQGMHSYESLGMGTLIYDAYSTDWLSLQMADLEHFSTITSRAKVIISDMWERTLETNASASRLLSSSFLPEIFQAPLLMLAEHKRNTSTAAQLSRYLMHSGTGIISNHTKLSKEIFELPIRTLVQAWLTHKQANWMMYLLQEKDYLRDFMLGLAESDATRDSLKIKSMYSSEIVDFQIIMQEIYYCNMFNQNHGFKGHRDKPIMEKMLNIEDLYKEQIKNRSIFKSWRKVYYDEDEMCTLNASFVQRCAIFYMSNLLSEDLIHKAALTSVEQSVLKVLKMTRSVVAVPDHIHGFASTSKNVEKATVFEAIYKFLNDLSEVSLSKIVKADPKTVAIFSTFSKNQIGSAREILIQAIRTRMHTAMMNSFYEELCKAHPKDMITKEHKKREIQSSSLLRYEDRKVATNRTPGRIAVTFSINSDASKWAPSMVMMSYKLVIDVIGEKLPACFLNFHTAMLASYSNKFLYVPQSILEKLRTWPMSRIYEDEIMSRIKEYSTNTGLMLIHSGMGQGNLQHGSGFVHCIVDDYSDHLTAMIYGKMGILYECTTLISSDDSTKMVYLEMSTSAVQAKDHIYKIMLVFADLYTGIRKMANIHINWKKTAIQMAITEFNSIFTILKRSYAASIKDAYNSVNIVDMTRPENAVKEALSAIQRLRDAGAYLPTLKIAMKEMRAKLISWYNYNKSDINYFMHILKCSEEDLPFNLGFLPLQFPFEVISHGPEFMIANAEEGSPLQTFYKNIYATSEYTQSEVDWDFDTLGKLTLTTSKRTDKQLQEVKRMVKKGWGELTEDELGTLVLNNLESSDLYMDVKLYLKSYIMSVKRTYAFNSTFRYNSVVRAMSLKNSCRWVGSEDEPMTIFDAVKKIMALSVDSSYYEVFDVYRPQIIKHQEMMQKMDQMSRIQVARHPKTRTLLLYKTRNNFTSTAEDIIEALFGHKREVRARHYSALMDFAKLLKVDFSDLLKNPMSQIKKRFPEKSFVLFRSYVEWFSKFNATKRISIISDFATSMDQNDDTFSWYCYKTNSEFIYSVVDSLSLTEKFKIMDNVMSLGTYKEVQVLQFRTESYKRKDLLYETISNNHIIDKVSSSETVFAMRDTRLFQLQPAFTRSNAKKCSFLSSTGKVVIEEIEERGKSYFMLYVYGKIDPVLEMSAKREISRIGVQFPFINIRYRLDRSNIKTVNIRKFSFNLFQQEVFCHYFVKNKLHIYKTLAGWTAKVENARDFYFMGFFEGVYHTDVEDIWKTQLMRDYDRILQKDVSLQEILEFVSNLPGMDKIKVNQKGLIATEEEVTTFENFFNSASLAAGPVIFDDRMFAVYEVGDPRVDDPMLFGYRSDSDNDDKAYLGDSDDDSEDNRLALSAGNILTTDILESLLQPKNRRMPTRLATESMVMTEAIRSAKQAMWREISYDRSLMEAIDFSNRMSLLTTYVHNGICEPLQMPTSVSLWLASIIANITWSDVKKDYSKVVLIPNMRLSTIFFWRKELELAATENP